MSQLLATLLILLAHVSVAVVVIGSVKVAFDRRLDQTLVAETLADAIDSARRGNADEAETRVNAIIEERSRLQMPLTWGLADYVVVMPELACLVSDDLRTRMHWAGGSPQEDAMRAELTLRTEGTLDSEAIPLDGGKLPPRPHELLPRPYAFLVAMERQDFVVVRSISDPSDPINLASLPPAALPHTASPLGYLAPIRDGAPHVMGPNEVPESLRDYYLGAVAFYQGRLDQAKQFLAHDWERSRQRPDTAYLLGAIAEANGEKDMARAWYGKAVATGQTYLVAARGYVRVGARN